MADRRVGGPGPQGGCRAGRRGLMSSGYCGNREGPAEGGEQGGRSGRVTMATDAVPSSPGLEMQLPLCKITYWQV